MACGTIGTIEGVARSPVHTVLQIIQIGFQLHRPQHILGRGVAIATQPIATLETRMSLSQEPGTANGKSPVAVN